jgi:hypothetical protein
MRPRTPTVKTAIKSAIAALLWLVVSESVSYAAPGIGRAHSRLVCDVQTQAQVLRKLLRHPKSYGGPLAARPAAQPHRLQFDLTHHLRRVKRAASSSDGVAIQNDAPAARVDADDQPLPSLESLGFVAGPVHSHPHTGSFSPRSPRGPPPVD